VSKKDITVRNPRGGGSLEMDMTVWDIMGEKGFRELLKEAYFHGAQGILAVCDVTRKDTLTDLHEWIQAVNKVTGTIPVHFLANKYDLKDHMAFTEQDLAAVASTYKSPYTFTSAKTGENVERAFQTIAELIAARMVPR
jgi:small GTP-binding protein